MKPRDEPKKWKELLELTYPDEFIYDKKRLDKAKKLGKYFYKETREPEIPFTYEWYKIQKKLGRTNSDIEREFCLSNQKIYRWLKREGLYTKKK